ncbi:MAG: AraC family transcriptional regulator [Muribaculaceae bacterium]
MARIKSGFTGERSLVLPKLVTDIMLADPLTSVLYITDIGYYPKARNHYRERTEPIDQYVFIYCIDGHGSYEVAGNRHNIEANQYFILPAGLPHRYEADAENPWTIYWIHFKGKLAKYYAQDAIEPHSINPGVHSRISNRINMFEELFVTLNASYSIENLRYAMTLFHHYLGSLRFVQQYRQVGDNRECMSTVDAAIHYMKENIERHLTLQDIAQYLGYSPSHFSMQFKASTGHSPLAYFNLLKIQEACRLLDHTSMKLNQVCYKLGIDDPYYFSRLFKKIMGMSPRAYRTLQKV